MQPHSKDASHQEEKLRVACDLRAQRRICFLRPDYAKKLRRTRRRTQTTKCGFQPPNLIGKFQESQAVIPGRHLVGLESPTYSKGKFQESKAAIPGRHLVGLESPTYSKGKFQESQDSE